MPKPADQKVACRLEMMFSREWRVNNDALDVLGGDRGLRNCQAAFVDLAAECGPGAE
jgi:hypothetical protein